MTGDGEGPAGLLAEEASWHPGQLGWGLEEEGTVLEYNLYLLPTCTTCKIVISHVNSTDENRKRFQ